MPLRRAAPGRSGRHPRQREPRLCPLEAAGTAAWGRAVVLGSRSVLPEAVGAQAGPPSGRPGGRPG